MDKTIENQYKKFRNAGCTASHALYSAKTVSEFAELEAAGLVKLEWVPDDFADMDDLKGDSYCPKTNFSIPRSRLEREEKEFERKVEREGVWGLVGEFWNPVTQKFEQADSCYGFVGQNAHGYEFDIMAETCRAYKNSFDKMISAV